MTSVQSFTTGQQLAGYRILAVRPIGAAELEAVARTETGEIVALHFLNWETLEIVYRARAFRGQPGDGEAVIAAAREQLRQRDAAYRAYKERAVGFRHPQIATIRKLGTLPSTGQTFVETDFLGGWQLLHEAAGMSWEQRLFLVPPLLDAVQALHDRGVLHGNLKHRRARVDYTKGQPGPHLLDPGYFVPMHTWPDGQIGSFEIVAPEVVERRLDQIDERTDLYGLGHLLYALFTDGRLAMPWRRDARRDLDQLRAIIATEGLPLPPSTYTRDLPPELDSLILFLLARDPVARSFASAADVSAYCFQHWPQACAECTAPQWDVSIETAME